MVSHPTGLRCGISILYAESIELCDIVVVNAGSGDESYARDLRILAPGMERDAYVTIHAKTRAALLLPEELEAEAAADREDRWTTAQEAEALHLGSGGDAPTRVANDWL
jgi:hypothetical protein